MAMDGHCFVLFPAGEKKVSGFGFPRSGYRSCVPNILEFHPGF